MVTRTAGELATTAPTGLIPAGFDGPGRPPAPYQMQPGEAWVDLNPADNPVLFGQAIVYCGAATRPPGAAWIAMPVTGPKGDTGPPGPQGPQGEVSMADLVAVVVRLDALQARVDRLESFQLVTMNADITVPDNTDQVITTVVLPAGGDAQGSAHLTFELTGATALARLVTAWIEGLGPVIVSGPASGQITLHQVLPYNTLDIGPVRATATGTGNVVLYVRSTDISGAAPSGQVIVKAATLVHGSATAKPLASGLIAR